MPERNQTGYLSREATDAIIEHFNGQGLKSNDIAELLEVHESVVSKIVSGSRLLSLAHVNRAAKRLGQSLGPFLLLVLPKPSANDRCPMLYGALREMLLSSEGFKDYLAQLQGYARPDRRKTRKNRLSG